MDKEQVIATLRSHEAELKNAGILHLRLFGSVSRGEAGPASDIDLAVVFDRSKVRGILAEVALRDRLSELLGAEADLANADTLKERIRVELEREAEIVF